MDKEDVITAKKLLNLFESGSYKDNDGSVKQIDDNLTINELHFDSCEFSFKIGDSLAKTFPSFQLSHELHKIRTVDHTMIKDEEGNLYIRDMFNTKKERIDALRKIIDQSRNLP